MRGARGRWVWLVVVLAALALVVRGATDSMWREIVIGGILALAAAGRLLWG